MNIIFSDETNKLNDEIKSNMQKAYVIALGNELGEMIDMPIAELAVELDVSIVSAEEIQLLNKEYREIDKVTDVLSFPQFENVQDLLENLDDEIETLLGDVVICYDIAEKQAEEYGTGISREIVYLFVHSVFHLLGYDHMDEADKKEMRQAEETVMEEIGL